MKKKLLALTLATLTVLGVTGCSNKGAAQETSKESENKEIKLTYKDKEYTVPGSDAKLVITGSLESLEDALLLGVKPMGAMTVGGSFPDMFKTITGDSKAIGEKTQPNVETILSLKPDLILGSSKFPEETLEKLNKIAPTVPVSHIATDWEANLILMGQLSGKEDKAKEIIANYKKDASESKEKLANSLKGKKVLAARIRAGNIAIYPANIFFNTVLYSDLGLEVPEPVAAAKAQENISLEKLSELNPDYIFLQFSEDENADKPKALEELESNPIWKNLNAVKNGKVFVNVVDPLAQGGTAWSKTEFLKAAVSKLSK